MVDWTTLRTDVDQEQSRVDGRMPPVDCVYLPLTSSIRVARQSKDISCINKPPPVIPTPGKQSRIFALASLRPLVPYRRRLATVLKRSRFPAPSGLTMAPSHPLRRLSTGSLSSLHRSQDRHHTSPSGLDFLSPAFQALNDEAAMLEKNVQQLNELHDALGTFNESFAGWLYALKMNAFCVEWPQVGRCVRTI